MWAPLSPRWVSLPLTQLCATQPCACLRASLCVISPLQIRVPRGPHIRPLLDSRALAGDPGLPCVSICGSTWGPAPRPCQRAAAARGEAVWGPTVFALRPSMDARLLLALGRCAHRLFSGPPRCAWGCHGAPEFPQIHGELGSRQSPGTVGLSCDFAFTDRPQAAFLPLRTYQLAVGQWARRGQSPCCSPAEGLSALLRETTAASPHARGPRWNQPVLLPRGCRLMRGPGAPQLGGRCGLGPDAVSASRAFVSSVLRVDLCSVSARSAAVLWTRVCVLC